MSTSKKHKQKAKPIEQPRDVIADLKADIAERNENAEKAGLEAHRATINQRRGVIKKYRAELEAIKPELSIVPVMVQLLADVRNMGWSDVAPMPRELGNAVAAAERALQPTVLGGLNESVNQLLKDGHFSDHELVNLR